jgi:hypothetical protein
MFAQDFLNGRLEQKQKDGPSVQDQAEPRKIKPERLGLIPAIAFLNNSGSGSEECWIQTAARVRTIVCMHRGTMYSQK